MSYINILGKKYEILDTKEYITLADSFLLNKIGSGHGEAKLYVGNESQELFSFWEDFNSKCFILKSDCIKFMQDAEDEYLNPQQQYLKKDKMPEIYTQNLELINAYDKEMLKFQTYRSDITPPRVYINSNSEIYTLIRALGLPNISYLSINKLKDESNGEVVYYFKQFIDYHIDAQKSLSLDEVVEQEKIETSENISTKKKEQLIQARIGQGEYRKKLLEDCMFCPITDVNDERLLVASHIKPWAKCNDKEKIDPNNGFMFTPTYDKLFDRGFISFDDDKRMMVSPWISPMNQKRLNIYEGKRIDKLQLNDKRKEYLEYHRINIFKG